MRLPARIEITSVSPPASGARSGAAASSVCGLMARNSTSGAASPASGGLSAMPRSAASAAIAGDGLGSRIVARAGARPPASQPRSSASPILPAPTRTSDCGQLSVAPLTATTP